MSGQFVFGLLIGVNVGVLIGVAVCVGSFAYGYWKAMK